MPVRIQARVAVDEPLEIRISTVWEDDNTKSKAGERVSEERQEFAVKCICKEETEAAVYGETVQPARKAPLTEESVRKQLTKMGESLLCVTGCEIEIEGEGFVPVRALNELRREAVTAFEAAVCEAEAMQKAGGGSGEDAEDGIFDGAVQNIEGFRKNINRDRPSQSTKKATQSLGAIHVLAATVEQFRAAVSCGCARIYMESDLFLWAREEIMEILRHCDSTCFLALPYILRERDEAYLQRLSDILREPETADCVQGLLVRSLEGLAFARAFSKGTGKEESSYLLVADAGLYCFNGETVRFLTNYVDEVTLPYELNAGEAAHLVREAEKSGVAVSLIVYSHIPMMITANCLAKTADACQNGAGALEKTGNGIGKERRILLKDRKEIAFPVVLNCNHCYNVLYNALPYSLHAAGKERERIAASACRYDFTTETGAVCEQILQGTYVFSDYTAGHCRRGVK